ncbi:MAG: aldose 1-epimerase family protein [Oscillospiraceae bacterium]|nr:aldose 1-epimerase family protein [Oscillospiraceae bacterium]
MEMVNLIINIKNNNIDISVNSLGAELYSVRAENGINYLWDGKPEYWKGRSPILFPIVGALRGGKADSKMGEVKLVRHGFARFQEWTTEIKGDDLVTLMLASSPETKNDYPYDFLLRVSYKLDNNSLTTTFSVLNTGDCVMPYCIGGHPAFNIPLVQGEEFGDYLVEFEMPETADCRYVDLETGLILTKTRRLLTSQSSFRLDHELFRKDALVFDDLKSRKVKLYSEKSGHGVQMDFSGMEYFAVWSPVKDSPFVCLEPWTGTATLESEDDIFENKRGMRFLNPGEEGTVSYTVTVF